MKKKDKLITKIYISIILFLILGILSKINNNYKEKIHYYLYEKSFNFNSIYSFYNKYLGGPSFYTNNNNNSLISVFQEKIKYKKIIKYKDGIKIIVDSHYLVPNTQKGIIIKKEKNKQYGNLIIIKTSNNINIWYGNICNSSLKMYDYIEQGEYLGESCQNYIYILYEKNGIFLNYNNYFNK